MSWSALPNPPPPSFTWDKSHSPLINSLRFGDDYYQETNDGNVSDQATATINYKNLNETEKDTIEGFLTGLGGVFPFSFTPPGAASPQTFLCKSWTISMTNGHLYDMTVPVRRIMDTNT